MLRSQLRDLCQRNFEVLVNVVAQRFERRNVKNLGFIGKRAVAGGAHQAVQADQERGQGLAGPRGG